MNCLPSLYTLLSTQIKQYVWPQAHFQAEVFELIPNFFFLFIDCGSYQHDGMISERRREI